jgi:flagellar motor switch protein FliM/flagellar motor switch protein FliG
MEPSRVKPYDFTRPDKFSKDQIMTMSIMHEMYARQVTTTLSSLLVGMVHVHVASVDQLTYEEFCRSIPNPTTLAIMEMDPLKGAAVLEIDPSLTNAMLDRLFGGPGNDTGARRELTDIESSVVEGVILRLLTNLRDAWKVMLDLRPRLAAMETNPSFAQIVPPMEMVILVTLEAAIGDARGMINLCFPYLTIEPIIPLLSARYLYSSMRRTNGKVLAPTALSLPMTVEICYEAEPLSLSALQGMRKGMRIGLPGYGEGAALLQSGGMPVQRLAALRARRGQRTVYRVTESRIGKDIESLRAENTPQRAVHDELRGAVRSLSEDLGTAVKSINESIQGLARKQEDITEELILQSANDRVEPGTPLGKHRRPFGTLGIDDCDALAGFIGREHPQLIALVLSHLEPGLAACVLSRTPEEIQADVAERVCSIGRVSPEILQEVERVMDKKLSLSSSEKLTSAGGIRSIVEILNVASRGVEKRIVESLGKTNPSMAEEIKKRMFVFEDIVLLDRQAVSLVLGETPIEDLAVALKTTDQKVRSFIGECLSREAAGSLTARLESLGRTRLADVDAAQQRIIALVRRMEEEGRIVVARPDETVV